MLLPVVKVSYFFARKIFFPPAKINSAITLNFSVSSSPELLLRVVELGATDPAGCLLRACLMARLPQELRDCPSSLLVQTAETN